MIVNIAGTSGSGKSYLVRQFMGWADGKGVLKPLYDPDQSTKRPIGYDVILPKSNIIHIVGPYEKSDTAGCDILRNVETAYECIHEAYDAGKTVIFEGLFMMNMTRGPQLVELYGDVRVIQLADPLAVCIASINDRREGRGEGPLLKKENTVGNFKRANNYCDKMRAAGATVVRTKREDALDRLLSVLEL